MDVVVSKIPRYGARILQSLLSAGQVEISTLLSQAQTADLFIVRMTKSSINSSSSK